MKKKTKSSVDKSKHDSYTTYAKIIKIIKKNRYISQTTLAEMIGVSKQAISQNIKRHNIKRYK